MIEATDFIEKSICRNCVNCYFKGDNVWCSEYDRKTSLNSTCASFDERKEPLIESATTEIFKLLDEKDPEIKYLDLGETKGNWYYGFNLRGKEAIILSELRKILRNTEEKFKDKFIGNNEIKEFFDYGNGYLGDIAPTIAKETLKKYITKISRDHIIHPKELYRQIKEKILYYMDFGEREEIADVMTCWIIATYCYPLFWWFANILINAPSQSGKSKCGYIIMILSFRGFDLGASAGVTPAQVYRTLEGNRGTILLDEYEQSKDDTQKIINQIINAGATRNAYVIRAEQIDKKWKSWKFPIFCPKIVCNISGINPTSLSRFISFKWLATKGIKGSRKPHKQKDLKELIPLREDCYLLILENWKEIKKIYEDLELSNLKNRNEDNWLPLFTIAKFIDQSDGDEIKVENQLNKFLENYAYLEIETNDDTEEFFKILLEKIDEERYYTPKELGQIPEIQELLNYLKSPAHWIGKKLKLYQFKFSRAGGIRKYLLSKSSIQNVIDIYYTNITSHNDTNDTQQHKQHIIALKEEVNVPLGDISVITRGIPVGSKNYIENGESE